MTKKYLRLKKDLKKILTDNFIATNNSKKSSKHLEKIINLILKKCITAHQKENIFDVKNSIHQSGIVQFIFKEPIRCIKDFFQAVFGNILVSISQFKKHDIYLSCLAKQSIKALIKIIISFSMVSIMFIYALDSAAPVINILMLILALGFISRHYSHN